MLYKIYRKIIFLFNNYKIKKKRREFNYFLEKKILNYHDDTVETLVIVDALWDNPFHFLRLLLFKIAGYKQNKINFLGLINTEIKKETLLTFKSLKLKKIISFDEERNSRKFHKIAKKIQLNLIFQKKFLKKFPINFIIDDMCKREGDPSLNNKSKVFIKYLAKTLAYLEHYEKIIKNYKITYAILSHQVAIRYSTLIWLLVKNKKPVYITHYYNGHITCRKIKSKNQINSIFDDRIYYNEYKKLNKKKITKFIKIGKKYLSEVNKNKVGEFSRINVYKTNYYKSKKDFLKFHNLDKRKKNIFIYTNCWTDYPNAYGSQWYKNYHNWFEMTLELIKNNKECNWVIKPHPAEKEYISRYTAMNLFQNFQKQNDKLDNIVIDYNLSGNDTINISDTIITTIGTSAIELAAKNKEVIYCGNSPYSDFKFGKHIKNFYQYKKIIKNLHKINIKKNPDQAYFYYGANIADNSKYLIYPYNSLGSKLYFNITEFVQSNESGIKNEIKILRNWIKSNHSRYNVFKNFYIKKL